MMRYPVLRLAISAVIVFKLSRLLNDRASRATANNSTRAKDWNKDEELVVVTGGSSGIGASIVERLTKDGVRTVVLDRNEGISTAMKDCHFYKVDLSSAIEIAAVAHQIRSAHGNPTVLINNAGVGFPGPLQDDTEDNLRAIFNVNLFAPMLLSKQFLPAMLESNHGHIVNVSSMSAYLTQAKNVSYCCSKAALMAFHEGLRQELRHIYKADRVRTTVVHPAWVKTPMVQALLDSGKLDGAESAISPEAVADSIVEQIYSGHGATLILPTSLSWVALVRGLPTWFQESMLDNVSAAFLKGLAAMKI